MKLSVSYNFFNGHEHLLASIRSIRSQVDHISIVWQRISNRGEEISEAALDALADAPSKLFVDAVCLYRPDLSRSARTNELQKRRAGLRLAKAAACTHFFTMDADEFYRPDELAWARAVVEAERLTSTSVPSFMHIRRPIYRALDTTNCAFITKINLTTRIGARRYPVSNVDSTRRLSVYPQRHRHFRPEEIAMYHMNLVRTDIGEKLRNSSTTDRAFLSDVRESTDRWQPGETFRFGRKGNFEVFEVPNEFGTFDPS